MKKAVFFILTVAVAVGLLACAGPTRVEKHFGKSVKQARLNQILDPEAELNLDPVTGMDGKAAEAGIKKYWKSFEGHGGAQSFGQGGSQVVDKPIESGGYGSGYNK